MRKNPTSKRSVPISDNLLVELYPFNYICASLGFYYKRNKDNKVYRLKRDFSNTMIIRIIIYGHKYICVMKIIASVLKDGTKPSHVFAEPFNINEIL